MIKFTEEKLEQKEVLFYINHTLENGWSRDILALQIKSNLYAKEGDAITNFKLGEGMKKMGRNF